MARRIIDTGITKEMLTGDNFPQIQIGNKLYVVDNRKKTFDEITKIQEDTTLSENAKTEQIYIKALGKDEAKEILDLDLSVEQSVYLSYCIMGAITGEEPEELLKKAREEKN